MKQTTFLTPIIFLLSTFFVSSQGKLPKDAFTFSGKVIGQPDGYVHLMYINKNAENIDDSCLLKDGRFYFKGQINEAGRASFSGKTKSISIDDLNFTEFFLEPTAMQATFEVDNFKHGKITGSKSQNEFATLFRAYEIVTKKWKSQLDQMMDARSKNDWGKSDSIRNTFYSTYFAERTQTSFNFIKSHPDSYISPYLFRYLKRQVTLDSAKMFYAHFSPRIQQSNYGKELMDFITKTENITIGNIAPNFKEKDIMGNLVSLKDFNGKYVLLEFWASWCGPCRAENPNLLNAYNQYKNKNFIVLGISLDEKKDAWLKAVQKDKLLWPNICDFKGWQSDRVKQYNLNGKSIPSNFLIDPAGKIIAMDLWGDDLNKKLSELLAKSNP